VQGYNAQAAMNEKQIVLAAEISVDSPDFGYLEPMVVATVAELTRAGVAEQPEVAVADAGYWHYEQMDSLAANGIAVLIPPDAKEAQGSVRTASFWLPPRRAWTDRASTLRRSAASHRRTAPPPATGISRQPPRER
jgi:hypothetical protein